MIQYIFWPVVPVFPYAALHLGEHMPAAVPAQSGDDGAATNDNKESETA